MKHCYDKAMTMYATKLEHDAGVLPEIGDKGAHIRGVATIYARTHVHTSKI